MGNKKEESVKKPVEIMMMENTITSNYANYLRVASSSSDFLFEFSQIDSQGTGVCVSRIMVSPMRVKEFVSVMQRNIESFEKNNGIVLPETIEDYKKNGIKKS